MIRQTSVLAAAEHAVVFGSAPDPFGVAHLGLRWRPKDIHFLLDVDGEPTAHVGVLQHRVEHARPPLQLAGLGGVITAAGARGQGHASELIEHTIEFANTTFEADAVLLFCLPRLVTFYERLRFRLVTSPVTIDQPAGHIHAPLPVMVRLIRMREWPDGPFELGSLPW